MPEPYAVPDLLNPGDRVRLTEWPTDNETGRVAGLGILDGRPVYLVRLKNGGWLGDDAGQPLKRSYVSVLVCDPRAVEPVDRECSICRRRHGAEVEHASE